ncbi:MAG: flagellar protein FliS [Rickettsiales bacterium]
MYERHNPYSAYRDARHHQSPTEQLVTLYDGLIVLVRQGKEAIRQKDWEGRWKAIDRATTIVNGLRGAVDHEKGGQSAVALARFYEDVENRLRRVQCHDSPTLCDALAADIKTVRDAWAHAHETQAKGEQLAVAAAKGNLRYDAASGELGAAPSAEKTNEPGGFKIKA